MKNIASLTISKTVSATQAMKQLDTTAEKLLFVVDEHLGLFGALSDGDIRRWILDGGSLDEKIEKFCNKNPLYYEEGKKLDDVKADMLKTKIGCIPVVNSRKQVTDVFLWNEVFGGAVARWAKTTLSTPVVIMAGGAGTRLDPFTRILPKPLIPIGEKTLIEVIIEKFTEYSVDHFYISVNHKSRIIRSYFEELNPSYAIEYIQEDRPLGTAGSLKSLEERIHSSFIVTNCDVIIDADYSDIVHFHQKNNYELTIVASMKHFNIPYGICEIENGGALINIVEKPEYSYLINTGMYVLEPGALDLIPKDTFFHMTDLIALIKQKGGTVGVYPISEKSWVDTGEWAEYKKAFESFSK